MFGFLNCYKPAGMTSRDVVNIVQRRLPKKTKVGHAGTLDPLAEGVLVLGVGPAVRLVPFVQEYPKRYLARFRLGVSSDTGDAEGELTYHQDLPVVGQEQLESAARSLQGEIEQTPPAHSAIWVDGKRAYKRIRAGESFEMPKRRVVVHELAVTEFDHPDVAVDILCGSGTYVRTLGIDLAASVGTVATMTFLRRVSIGPFTLEQAVSLSMLRDDPIEPMLRPATLGVQHMHVLSIDDQQSVRLGHGLCIGGELAGNANTKKTQAVAVSRNGELRAVLRRKNGQWCPYRVFPVTTTESTN